jgi:hypothetical protein
VKVRFLKTQIAGPVQPASTDTKPAEEPAKK